ncbi:MAG TPA: hypothetical protein VMZ03_03085 [Chitinophagaceae bacterium]|nr:hypothetical protein [Chitinophagaceae bacterium]
MRFFTIPVLLECIVLFFSSCQKEVDWSDPVAGQDSIYMKKYIVIDTTEPSGADTIRIFDFNYNAQKRLSGYIHTIYTPGISGPARIRAILTYSYTYPGSDTLPSRIIENINDLLIPSNNITDTFYYFYQNGMVIKDSSGNASEYFVDEIMKLSPTRTLLRQQNLVPPFGLSTDTTYIYTSWLNGNLVRETDSLWMPSLGFYDITDNTVNYDNKPNPFRRLVLPYTIPYNNDIFGTSLEGIAPPTLNNIIFFDQDGSTLTSRYQYRADGYPVIGWDDDGAKCFYQYTRL